ncbi:uncharacterized protein B0T15DRAFT_105873 [Chaetomium strumarium]|uniref:Uncharacterized protein n=1 Tax=Chaetomium strumarium TaxID=1170767 RepID=A0AAJ0GY70_9PEZI|nr:hypothetical protein B0T15DRAFT_105873 [Chaetomium strumarium]
MAPDREIPHPTSSSRDLGDRSCGSGVPEVLDVIRTLESREIPNCVTGARALVYYGAGRVAQDWEVAVPDELFHKAKVLFSESPQYELLKPAMPQPRSLIHTYPLFKLKGAGFSFFLVPASEPHVSCEPAVCERSHNGIPYPKLEHFAQSLLDTQKYADLEDLVDGMDLDEAWGEANLQLDQVPSDYINHKNTLICQSLPGLPGLVASLSTIPDARREWMRTVQGKRSRMVPKYPHEKYATRFRLKGSPDPRMNQERQV